MGKKPERFQESLKNAFSEARFIGHLLQTVDVCHWWSTGGANHVQ